MFFIYSTESEETSAKDRGYVRLLGHVMPVAGHGLTWCNKNKHVAPIGGKKTSHN